MSSPSAPSYRKQIPGVITAPVVERSFPPVKHDMDLISVHCTDRRRTQQLWVLPVDCFQLHADFKLIGLGCRRLLTKQTIAIPIGGTGQLYPIGLGS